nr:SGNH/GDSL hydrolase family protein [Alicyclobacillus ferrooxydans]
MGDSITAGYSATSPCLAYPSRVTEMLRAHRSRSVGEVLAEAGWTSADLRSAVFAAGFGPLVAADAISVWVGGDDLVDAALGMLQTGGIRRAGTVIPATLKHYGMNLAGMIAGIRKVSKAKLIVCTQYNPFPNSPIAVESIQGLNTVTAEVAQKTGCLVAPVHEWFAGRQAALIAGYRTGQIEDVLRGSTAVHPNNRGHNVIATNLLPLVMN